MRRLGRVAIAGYYGMQNFGDDLFVAVATQRLRRQISDEKLCVISPPIADLEHLNFACSAKYASSFMRENLTGATIRGLSQIRAKLISDTVIYAGGSLFKNANGIRFMTDQLAFLVSKRFIGLGISIGPFENSADEKQVLQHLRMFSHLTVRDQTSLDWAKANLNCAVECFGDLAGALRLPIPNPKESKTLGLNLAQFRQFTPFDGSPIDEHYRRLLACVAEQAQERRINVKLFDLNGHPKRGDGSICEVAVNAFRQAGVEATMLSRVNVGLEGILKAIGSCDWVVSARLHGAIAAYLYDIPFALLEYEQKCTEFLCDIGQPQMRSGLKVDSDSDKISSVLRNLLVGREVPTFSSEQYRSRSLSHFEGLRACQEASPQ